MKNNNILPLLLTLVCFLVAGESVAQIARTMEVNNTGTDGGKTTYAVIDCSGMPPSTIKTKQELINSKVVGYGMIRPTATSYIDKDAKGYITKLSRRFAVANEDLPKNNDSSSSLQSGKSWPSWYQAVGWKDPYKISNSPTHVLISDYNDADIKTWAENNIEKPLTGCAAYKGAGDKDTPGTWRMPTQFELVFMMLYGGQLKKIHPTFNRFTIVDNNLKTARQYFSTVQVALGSAAAEVGRLREMRSTNISKQGGFNTRARCIRDLYD